MSQQLAVLDHMGVTENRTQGRNVKVLRAYLAHSFAVENALVDRERARIDKALANATLHALNSY